MIYNELVIQKNDKSRKFNGENFIFNATDGTEIHGCRWIPKETNINSVLIINHGMAEHICRYDDFACFLNDKGIAVWGEDHRGHGLTAGAKENLGFFADSDGWMKVVGDIRVLHNMVKEAHPAVPVIMLGHSMGSFLTRHYISLYGQDLSRVIISGTGFTANLITAVASLIARSEILSFGKHHRSKVLDTMSFGAFNKPFSHDGDSGFEWLSRDKEQIKKYMDDPLCGFICTSSHFKDLFSGLKYINNIKAFKNTAESIPILLISGEKDPVGGNGKGVKKVFNLYKKTGNRDIELLLIPEARHECLHEINRKEIFNTLSNWMEKK